jgi:hypothetical protein
MDSPDKKSPWSTDGLKLFLLGYATLFLELVLIRYLAGNIWNLGYFPNFVLMAVFVGMGIGFIFHHYISDRASHAIFHAALFVLLFLVVFVYFRHPAVPGTGEDQGTLGGELFFTITRQKAEEIHYFPFALCFLCIIAIFIFISQRTAKLFRLFKPLTAYTLDILGSCCGIMTFMCVSYFKIPAYLWFAYFTLIFIIALPAEGKRRWLPLLPGIVVVFYAYHTDTRLLSDKNYTGPLNVIWSPYQKVEYADNPSFQMWSRHVTWVNGIRHQQMIGGEDIKNSFYQIPYAVRAKLPDLPKYRNVLIIGAGGGNDVDAALMNGAEHVDAVEIDPVIANIGRKFHPDRVYDDPRVNLVVDDGRAFLTRTKMKYDLIIFALTDSLVKVSSMSQLRLENYLFTEQSAKRAYNLLSDTGDLIFYNYYRHEWLVAKIREMIHKAVGKWPVFTLDSQSVFAIVKTGKLTAEPPASENVVTGMDIPSDDWPFLYLKQRGIPSVYLKAMIGMGCFVFLMLAVLQVVSTRNKTYGGGANLALKIAFVFMGTAFLLLETKSVIQFSLLFGTTWVNNSLVFLAVLLLVLAANWSAYFIKSSKPLPIIFVLLIASSLITLVYPLGNLLNVESALMRFVLASLITFSPIYFANLIFSVTFRDQNVPEHIFGWNLIGTTIGGVLEYTSMAVGYNFLSVIVAVCYTIVFAMIMISRAAEGKSSLEAKA